MAEAAYAIVDTSVWIELFRYGHFEQQLAELPYLLRHASVVLSELRRGAGNRNELRLIDGLDVRGRVFCPGAREWRRSGDILQKLRSQKGYDPRKLRDLHFDALIALTARAIGAVVITCNGTDFEALREHERFALQVWTPPRK